MGALGLGTEKGALEKLNPQNRDPRVPEQSCAGFKSQELLIQKPGDSSSHSGLSGQ